MYFVDQFPLSGAAILIFLLLLCLLRREEKKLRHIPTVGYSAPLFTYLTSFQYVFRGRELIHEGYNKYRNGVYKISNLDRWIVFVAKEKLIEELCSAPENSVSIERAVDELLHLSVTMGEHMMNDLYHIQLVRSQMTRNLSAIFPEVHDEIATALSDLIDGQANEEGHTKVNGYDFVTQVICRAVHRVIVGNPLCRDPQYVKLHIRFVQDFVIEGQLFFFFPKLLRPYFAKLLPRRIPQHIRRGVQLLKSLIEQRQKDIEQRGKEYPGKPNDFLSWMLDVATPSEKTILNLTKRILLMSFTSIPTTSTVLTHALFHLATMPDVALELREEVESIVASQGWSKSSIAKMNKLDSFLRENQRFQGMGEVSSMRIAVKDFTFSDGTMIPAGTYIKVPAGPIHRDRNNYADGETMKPFRFVETSEIGTTSSQQNHYVTTSTKNLGFGHGLHACPGRFFAVTELKIMIGLIVLNYDIGLANGKERPKNLYFLDNCLPNPKSEITFKKREW